MAVEIETTGERVVESSYLTSAGGYLIYLMHMAAYRLAEPFCRGKRVIELGCGTGYGASHIAEQAHEVHAVDVASDAIDYARHHYAKPNLAFELVKEGQPLPFPDQSFDVALSFQVLEHVRDDTAYLAEAKRLLRSGGTLLLVTPDRRHRLLAGQRPWNRWHAREYGMEDLVARVQEHFHVSAQLYMGLKPPAAELEFQRYRLIKWLSLPWTFPGVPERWRQWGLSMLHALRRRRRRAEHTVYQPNFGPEVIEIGEQVAYPVNLIINATRPADAANQSRG
jgi:ubiquinone/menaquinone biosynthesis C-methylase UbiE